MSQQDKEQKCPQFHNNHHWSRGCQVDEGLLRVGRTEILDRNVNNWKLIRWSNILLDKQLEVERGLCKNNQEDKWSSWLSPSALDSTPLCKRLDLTKDQNRRIRQGTQSKSHRLRVKRNQVDTLAQHH